MYTRIYSSNAIVRKTQNAQASSGTVKIMNST